VKAFTLKDGLRRPTNNHESRILSRKHVGFLQLRKRAGADRVRQRRKQRFGKALVCHIAGQKVQRKPRTSVYLPVPLGPGHLGSGVQYRGKSRENTRGLDTLPRRYPLIVNSYLLSTTNRHCSPKAPTMSEPLDTIDSSPGRPVPPSQASPVVPQLGVKLRSSCNACGDTKTRCDRGQPECGRCIGAGLPCVYGPSRNCGKPPRKRIGVGLDRQTQKRLRTQTTELHGDSTVDTAGTRDTGYSRLLVHSSGTIDALSHQQADADGHLLSSGFCPPLPLEDWSQLWNLDGTFDLPSDSLMASAGASRELGNDPESHSCPRESYEIFRDLICPSPTLHAPESNSTVSARLDEVLLFNRTAISRLTRLLKCPCAKSGHRAVVHASILSRILIWYQQAAGWPSSDTSGSASMQAAPAVSPAPYHAPLPVETDDTVDVSADSSPPAAETTASLVHNTGFAVELLPLSIGNFTIEDQDVLAAFRNQVVLSELKKMAALIEIFITQDSCSPLAGSMSGLNSLLGAWLRSEHSRTVGILQDGLARLNNMAA